MQKFICLVENKSLPNNPRIHTTRESASQESLRLAAKKRKTTHVVEVLETYEVEVKKTYDRSEVIDTKTLKDGDEGVFTDPRNGREYKTLIIGEHEWMNENLYFDYDESKFRPAHEWSEKDECLYSLTEDDNVGYLYQWSAAMQCAEGLPNGWRLPTKEDFEKANLGENPKWNRTYAGYRTNNLVGELCNRGSGEHLWSSSHKSDSYTYFGFLHTSTPSSSIQDYNTKAHGFSVRLVRDIA